MSSRKLSYSPGTERYVQVSNKLDHVSGKFTSLYSDLENEKQQKRLTETEKYTLLKERLNALESNLQAEVARRYEADRSLQSHVDAELTKLSERMTTQFKELQLSLRGSLDHLGRTINEINSAITEEREQRRADIDHVGTSLCARLDESVAAVEDERFARLEQERESLRRYRSCISCGKKVINCTHTVPDAPNGNVIEERQQHCAGCARIGEDLFKINERIDCEKQCREQAVNEIGAELHEFIGSRASKDEQFNARVLDEVSSLRSKLNHEVTERVQEDEAIVHAINEYTRALQEGLRIVGSS